MTTSAKTTVLTTALALSILAPAAAEAQFGGLLGRATRAIFEKLLRDGVRCVIGDDACVEEARAEGKTPVITDADGEVLTDEEGTPITDPADVPPDVARAARRPAAAGEAPGTGVWVNYDFVPGDLVLFYDDYMEGSVGDVPRQFGLLQGNWEMVEWEGSRVMRATSEGAIAISLPATLPDRFTLEFPASVQNDNASVRVSTSPLSDYIGSTPTLTYDEGGLRPEKDQGPTTMTRRREDANGGELVTVRIMADGDDMKMYLDDHRVANAPNAVFPRTNTIYLTVGQADEDNPVMIGAVRIAARELDLDLYDRLERDGRVATHGILFHPDSDVIRSESTPTLTEIGSMLERAPDLRLTIEAHTDTRGDGVYNQELSDRRSQAVKAYLVDTHGVDAGRLETVGFGESQPVAYNGSPAGKAQNRRVELVRR